MDMAKFREIILLLVEGNTLLARYKDHPLGGEWKHYRECHIEPDWLLLYKVSRATTCTSSEPGRIRICSKEPASFVGCEPFELADADGPLGENSADFQLSPHGDDATPQRTDVHVGSVFEL